MAIPCQNCPDEFDDIQSWIIHQITMHGNSRRESHRETNEELSIPTV